MMNCTFGNNDIAHSGFSFMETFFVIFISLNVLFWLDIYIDLREFWNKSGFSNYTTTLKENMLYSSCDQSDFTMSKIDKIKGAATTFCRRDSASCLLVKFVLKREVNKLKWTRSQFVSSHCRRTSCQPQFLLHITFIQSFNISYWRGFSQQRDSDFTDLGIRLRKLFW